MPRSYINSNYFNAKMSLNTIDIQAPKGHNLNYYLWNIEAPKIIQESQNKNN